VKSSNILLDNKWNAKVADFGISKENTTDATHVSTAIKGTAGYIDPEYFVTNRLTTHSDVYSFGIVLLELISGRPPIIPKESYISNWVKSHVQEGHIERVVDPSLGDNFNMKNMRMIVKLALQCVESEGVHRPTMSTICQELRTLSMEIDRGSTSSKLWLIIHHKNC